ncbi:ABC transporter ATP-binding protein [Hungatella effluvii]|uniref:ABC transporter ATP-binding protein n=1 Tax=Hungatella effluvii TaxID=1096246 RepID=UPI0022E2061C|nr:ABC transporter ATP-binding protein [Hungatella effluvii]
MEIKLQNIRKRFGETVALDDLSLEFCDGKLTTLLGPSGCGKSTLLNLISGILPPTSGSIYFGDRDVTSLSPDKRNIGLVFQNYALYPHMTVGENIAFPLEIKKVSKKERLERAAEFAKLLRIEYYFNRKPSQLSGGQQQRVAIARALAKEPEILLLDEPLSNLDARLRLEMREEIRRLQLETGITTIFVTHDQEEALSISDHILLLKKGRIQQYGLPQELYDEPCNPFVADFLGNPPINLYEGVVDGDRVILQGDNLGFLIVGLKGIETGRRVKLGIRSEAFEAAAEGVYETPATVRNVFLNGKETLYLLEIGGKEFRSTLESGQTYEIGGKISVRLKKKGVHIYDSETEEKIG